MGERGPPLSSPYSVELGFSFNKRLGNNLSFYRNAVLRQDFDFVCIIDGAERTGKSVLAQQVAMFLDKDRELDVNKQICWTQEELEQAIATLPEGKAVILDEARRSLNRRRSMESQQLKLLDLFAEIGQKHLFLIMVLPSFYDMDLNIAVHRSRVLIHTWASFVKNEDGSIPEEPLQRGNFRYYSEQAKNHLYTDDRCRRKYLYPWVEGSFDASFTNHYCVPEAAYRRAKKRSLELTMQDVNRASCAGCGSSFVEYRSRADEYVCRRCGDRQPANKKNKESVRT